MRQGDAYPRNTGYRRMHTSSRTRAIPALMRAAIAEAPGGPEKMMTRLIPVPQCGAADVLVRVHAAGINPIDWKTRQCATDPAVHFPVVLGLDLAGEVVKPAGGFKIGDRVFGYVNMERMGAY